MGNIQFYLFRLQVVALIFVTLALTSAIWLTQSLRFVKLTVSRGLSASIFMELTLLLVPSFMLIILPVSIFFAVLFVYNKLTNDREIVVMRACGISHYRLARPALWLAVLTTMLCYAISLYVMPVTFRYFKEMEFAVRNTYSAALLQDGTFNTVTDTITVYVRERSGDDELLGILVQDNQNPEKPITMMAEQGLLVRRPEGPKIIMVNGNRQELDRESGRVSVLYFDRWSLDIDWLSQKPDQRWRQPTERFIWELLWPGDSEAERYYADQFRAEGHSRLANPLYPLTLTIIALAGLLSGQFNKRGQTVRLLVVAGLAALIQGGAMGVTSLAVKVPATIPLIYLNALVPAALGLYVLGRRPRQRRVPADPGPPLATQQA